MGNYLLEIGTRIREERERQGLSQEKLADLTKLGRVTISRFETGTQRLSMENAVKICKALHISMNRVQPECLDEYECNADTNIGMWLEHALAQMPAEIQEATIEAIKANVNLGLKIKL